MEVNEDTDYVKQPAKRKTVKRVLIKKLMNQVLNGQCNQNAIGALLALFEKESFRIEVKDHKGGFKAVLYIDGTTYESEATQKKKARNEVATKFLKLYFNDVLKEIKDINSDDTNFVPNSAFEQLSNEIMKHSSLLNGATKVPIFTNDTTLEIVAKCDKLHASQEQNGNLIKKARKDCMDCNHQHLMSPKRKEMKSHIMERVVKQALGIEECANPNTVTALYALFERDSFYFEVLPVESNEQKFLAHLHINGKTYSKVGSNIKKAKTNATILALKDLFPEIACLANGLSSSDSNSSSQSILKNESCDDNLSNLINGYGITYGSNGTETCSRDNVALYSFSDFIASLIQSKYNSVVQSYEEHLQRYSVLAGIVMIQQNDVSTASVICVCTGNKCLQGDHVSKDGNVLFDCHAEILARRCLMLYLYSQLNLSLSSNNKTILEIADNGCYRVKEDVKFYLYISSAPCGDGRVFNFAPPKNPDRPKLAEKRGILRVKLECGMGGIPVTDYMKLNPTFEDYMKGQQLVLMCCSAKLMRSNVLGTQGALLSHFLEPVYFHGILIGDIFHKGNLERALYGRAECPLLDELPKPFNINKPFIEGITNSKIVINIKPGKSCMNWIVNEPSVEFIKIKTGLTDANAESRLCKRNLFKRFLDIFILFKDIKPQAAEFLSYHAYKESSVNYQKAKSIFFQALEMNLRGQWIRKSKVSDTFTIEPIKSEVMEKEVSSTIKLQS